MEWKFPLIFILFTLMAAVGLLGHGGSPGGAGRLQRPHRDHHDGPEPHLSQAPATIQWNDCHREVCSPLRHLLCH